MPLPAKLPKWAQGSVSERHEVNVDGTVGTLIDELAEFPSDAYIALETDYYGEGSRVFVEWFRDMSEAEFVAEKNVRAKRRVAAKKATQDKLAAERSEYERLKEKFDV